MGIGVLMHNSKGDAKYIKNEKWLAVEEEQKHLSKALHAMLMCFLTVNSSSAVASSSYQFLKSYDDIEKHKITYKSCIGAAIGVAFTVAGARILTSNSHPACYRKNLFCYYYTHIYVALGDIDKFVINFPVAALGLSIVLIESMIAAKQDIKEKDIEAQQNL